MDDGGGVITGTGKIGEMIVQSGSMTAGYWRDPELTAGHIRDGWFHTGDLASKDQEDFYWFVSRKAEIIRHREGLVSPIDVEGTLYQHPAIREAGVVGVPDPDFNQVPQACVVTHKTSAPLTENDLIDFAKARLPEFKVPGRIFFVEELPHGPTGKIDRKTLKRNLSKH